MEAGPSTLVPSYQSHDGPEQALRPTGGFVPETTANAEQNQKEKEGDEALVSDFYHFHVPRFTE